MKDYKNYKKEGKSFADWGFTQPENGWHIAEVQEGIGPFINRDDEEVMDKKGNRLITIPFKIAEGDSANAKVNMLVSENTPRGGQKMYDLLVAINEADAFDKKFGANDVFDAPVMDAINKRAVGRVVKIYGELDKTGKYWNVNRVADVKDKVEDEKPKGKEKPKAAASASSDWD